VLMDILGSEGAVVLSDTLGTIAPKTSKLATFTANLATLGTGTPISLSTLPVDNRYAAKLTVTATPADVSVTCV